MVLFGFGGVAVKTKEKWLNCFANCCKMLTA
jgi:hypothetical protein